MAERYSELAGKEIRSQEELETAMHEMRIMKEQILSRIIEAKKLLKTPERETKL